MGIQRDEGEPFVGEHPDFGHRAVGRKRLFHQLLADATHATTQVHRAVRRRGQVDDGVEI